MTTSYWILSYTCLNAIALLNAVDAVVLIAVTSPKLGARSDFNRFTPLHKIPYWRDGKGLSPRIGPHRLHFMSWQQNFSIHGVDDAHARRNRRLLLANIADLASLLHEEKEASIQFINACKEWLNSNGKRMVVITSARKQQFHEPISSLIQDPKISHIKTKIHGKNFKVMGMIIDVLAVKP